MKKTATILGILLVFLSACKDTKTFSVENTVTYKGTLPCADCAGIETTLTLNKDKTFVYSTSIENKGSGTHKGKYSVKENIVTIKGEGQTINFLMEDDKAIFMGKELKPNTGALAKEYELKKVSKVDSYLGIYKGMYPCADCEGIEATLELNKDKTFVYTTIYKGKKDAKFVEKGAYSVEDNIITIKVENDEPIHFLIGANKVSFMGKEKTPNTGEMAKMYDLKKN